MAKPDSGEPPSVTRNLARGAREGKAESLERLCARLAPALFGWASLRIPARMRGRLDRDDFLQDVWERALRAFDSFDPERGSFRGWIFQVAKHTLLDAHRRMAVRAAAFQPSEEGEHPARPSQVPDEVTSLWRRAAHEEAVQSFLVRIEQLPEPDRSLLVHCGLEGMPIAQAAMRVGLSYAAAEKRWQRVRVRIAERGVPDGMLDD